MKAFKIIWILLAIAFVIETYYFFNKNSSLKESYELKIRQYEESNDLLRKKIDSLLIDVRSLDSIMVFYKKTIEEKNKEIINLRRYKNEKMDSITNLSLDESISFLSNYLSKEDSVGR